MWNDRPQRLEALVDPTASQPFRCAATMISVHNVDALLLGVHGMRPLK